MTRAEQGNKSAHPIAPPPCLLQNLPAEESARPGQKCFMDVSPLFIAYTQTTELIEPSP
jgi:hypothetical protein